MYVRKENESIANFIVALKKLFTVIHLNAKIIAIIIGLTILTIRRVPISSNTICTSIHMVTGFTVWRTHR